MVDEQLKMEFIFNVVGNILSCIETFIFNTNTIFNPTGAIIARNV